MTLFIITASDCSACINFKTYEHQKLIKKLDSYKVDYQIINFTSRKDFNDIKKTLNQHHPNLFNHIKFLPTFMWANESSVKKVYGMSDQFTITTVPIPTAKQILKWLSSFIELTPPVTTTFNPKQKSSEKIDSNVCKRVEIDINGIEKIEYDQGLMKIHLKDNMTGAKSPNTSKNEIPGYGNVQVDYSDPVYGGLVRYGEFVILGCKNRPFHE